MHRVRITLNGALANPPTTVTDTRGVYELTNVPAGSYSITAARAGYLTLQYGQRRPREAGRTLEVKAGETIEGIDVGHCIRQRLLPVVAVPNLACRLSGRDRGGTAASGERSSRTRGLGDRHPADRRPRRTRHRRR